MTRTFWSVHTGRKFVRRAPYHDFFKTDVNENDRSNILAFGLWLRTSSALTTGKSVHSSNKSHINVKNRTNTHKMYRRTTAVLYQPLRACKRRQNCHNRLTKIVKLLVFLLMRLFILVPHSAWYKNSLFWNPGWTLYKLWSKVADPLVREVIVYCFESEIYCHHCPHLLRNYRSQARAAQRFSDKLPIALPLQLRLPLNQIQ